MVTAPDLDDFCPACERTDCVCPDEDDTGYRRTEDVPVKEGLL